MKYGIDIGHNCPPDTGARGIKQEDNLTMEVGTRVISKLRALGHQVVDCKPRSASTVASSLQQRCNIANSNRVERFVSIHFNAFNRQANGTEIYATSQVGRNIADPVLKNLVELGYFNRGVKDGAHLYVVRNTNMPAILIECCFCDAQKDMDLYNPESMANAIVKGLTGTIAPAPQTPGEKTILNLQKALNRLNMKDQNGKTLQEDGFITPETKAATQRFQTIVGITPTAVAGPTTWLAIDQIFAKPILRPNHAAGTTVKYLQHRIGVTTDGIYGPMTAAAVERYQKQKGLVADGLVGPQTWNHLIG